MNIASSSPPPTSMKCNVGIGCARAPRHRDDVLLPFLRVVERPDVADQEFALVPLRIAFAMAGFTGNALLLL